jgi:uncharacterized membrane protein YeaQ/YmgE (transglycosylase-associated protein family)
MHGIESPSFLGQFWEMMQLTAVALLAGYSAERLLDPDLGVRGLPALCGLAGLYVGAWMWEAGGWNAGPLLAGHALMPAFAGALMVAALFKLVSLGAAGPRW